MRVLRLACVTGAVMALAASSAMASGSFTLTATNPATSSGYAPTFTGNGLLGVRVPAAGQGYAGGTVPAQSELAGFYAKPTKRRKAAERVQQRANIPTWSTLTFSDGGAAVLPEHAASTTGWRQSIDLHTGVITTERHAGRRPTATSPSSPTRCSPTAPTQHVGLVQLTLTPQWSGTATVTDEIDGSSRRRRSQLTEAPARALTPPPVRSRGRQDAEHRGSRRRSPAAWSPAPTSPPPRPRSIRPRRRASASRSASR